MPTHQLSLLWHMRRSSDAVVLGEMQHARIEYCLEMGIIAARYTDMT
jgi:hypothetical protein